ncbi:MAG: 16S rRNA (guanine(527)-N(7))-methyltransferase RsmG [Flavobacteriales bacterium]
MELLKKYFPDLTPKQVQQFEQCLPLYTLWNEQINVISRKDIEHLYERHILHSLAIAKVIQFKKGTKIMDVGTGGGFPGIPLAILFPEADFLLVDSIGKKIKVVKEVSVAIGLKNLRAMHIRAEEVDEKFDFVVSRAVTTLPDFMAWVQNKYLIKSFNDMPNGLLYLKGGNLDEEISSVVNKTKLFNISDFFSEEFFDTKKVVYVKRFGVFFYSNYI